jgi:hypothetical protein
MGESSLFPSISVTSPAMRERAWVASWISDLVEEFTDNDLGLVHAVETLLHNRRVKKCLEGLNFMLPICAHFNL